MVRLHFSGNVSVCVLPRDCTETTVKGQADQRSKQACGLLCRWHGAVNPFEPASVRSGHRDNSLQHLVKTFPGKPSHRGVDPFRFFPWCMNCPGKLKLSLLIADPDSARALGQLPSLIRNL